MAGELMQTFLPYASFRRSAAVLDNKRLGKQRVETLQVMNVFGGIREGWGNHPIMNMWRGYECALMRYQEVVVAEWVSRLSGKGVPMRDTCLEKTRLAHELVCIGACRAILGPSGPMSTPLREYAPWWLGDARLHRSHQANLVRKDAALYGPVWPTADPTLEYWWPVPKRGS